jgi:hypothetical protein
MTADETTEKRYAAASVNKEYLIPQARPEAFMIEVSQWIRLRSRVERIGKRPTADWLTTVASTVLGIAASSLLAVIVLPQSGGTQLASGVKPALWSITIAGTVLGIVLLLVHRWLKSHQSYDSVDICDEMDTIQEVWLERESG